MLFKSDQCLGPLSVINILVRRSCFLVCYCALVKVHCSVVLRKPCRSGSPSCLLVEPPPYSQTRPRNVGVPSHWLITVRIVMQVCPWEMAGPLQPESPVSSSLTYSASDFTLPSPLPSPLTLKYRPLRSKALPASASPPLTFTGIYFFHRFPAYPALRGPKSSSINQSSLRKWGVRWGCEIGFEVRGWEISWNSQTLRMFSMGDPWHRVGPKC